MGKCQCNPCNRVSSHPLCQEYDDSQNIKQVSMAELRKRLGEDVVIATTSDGLWNTIVSTQRWAPHINLGGADHMDCPPDLLPVKLALLTQHLQFAKDLLAGKGWTVDHPEYFEMLAKISLCCGSTDDISLSVIRPSAARDNEVIAAITMDGVSSSRNSIALVTESLEIANHYIGAMTNNQPIPTEAAEIKQNLHDGIIKTHCPCSTCTNSILQYRSKNTNC